MWPSAWASWVSSRHRCAGGRFSSRSSASASLVETPLGEARQDFAKAMKEIDRTVGRVFERIDASLEPVSELLPPSAQAVVQQAREVRDQLRGYFTSLAA